MGTGGGLPGPAAACTREWVCCGCLSVVVGMPKRGVGRPTMVGVGPGDDGGWTCGVCVYRN